MKFLIPLAQDGSEHMILSAVQLLGVTLVTWLLLIPLVILLVITMVVLMALVVLKSRA